MASALPGLAVKIGIGFLFAVHRPSAARSSRREERTRVREGPRPRPGSLSITMEGWREAVERRFGVDAPAVRAAVELSTARQHTRAVSLHSIAELERVGRCCSSLGDSEDDECKILIGWLGCVGDEGIAATAGAGASPPIPSDAGTLQLTDDCGARLRCSVYAKAVPPPELWGHLVLATRRAYVVAARGGATGAHLEIDAPLVGCLPPCGASLPRRPRKAYGDGDPARTFSASQRQIAAQLAKPPQTSTPTRKRNRAREADAAGRDAQLSGSSRARPAVVGASRAEGRAWGQN